MDKSNIEDNLFSKFSHDLRGSFVSILGYTELLNDPSEKVDIEEVKEFVKRIDFRTKEAYELLDNFINWLKLERYNKKLSFEKNSLFDTITEAKFIFDNVLKKKSVRIINEVKKNSSVFVDLQILQGIVKNILGFISKNIKNNSKLKISNVDYTKNTIVKFEFTSGIDEYSLEALSALNKNDFDFHNIPNELLFTKKFVELSKGKFELFAGENFTIKIIISLPKN